MPMAVNTALMAFGLFEPAEGVSQVLIYYPV